MKQGRLKRFVSDALFVFLNTFKRYLLYVEILFQVIKISAMNTNYLQQFGLHVRSLRQGQNLSQEELAEKANMHRTYIGMIERGERNPALLNLIRLAHALNVSLTDLVDFLYEEKHESH